MCVGNAGVIARARAVELLNGSAAWLRDAVVDTNTEQVTLRSNGVTVHDSTIRIWLSSVMNRMTDAERSVLVRQLRLSLGDGSKETSIDVVAGGRNYSHADDGSSLDTRSTVDPIYTLSAGNIVSLKSSNAVRVAQAGIDDADGFIFSSEGGAVLDHSGRVKRLGADGALRDTMFSGHKIRTICKGRGKEIWAVDESTEEIAVDADGRTRALTIPGLDDTQHVRAISVSPEGDRLAFSLESSKRAKSGIGIIGIRRGSDGEVESLARSFLRISDQSEMSMMTPSTTTSLLSMPRNMSRTTIHRSHDVSLCRVLKTISLFPMPEPSPWLPVRSICIGASPLLTVCGYSQNRRWLVGGHMVQCGFAGYGSVPHSDECICDKHLRYTYS